MAENDTSKNWPALEKKFGETMKFVGIQRNKRCWANLLMNCQGPRGGSGSGKNAHYAACLSRTTRNHCYFCAQFRVSDSVYDSRFYD